MPRRIITVGDSTDHGGKVISGSPTHQIDGRAIARLDDLVDCPMHYPDGRPHGINKIIEGHATYSVDNKPVAIDGSRTECGCQLIGSVTATVG
ncbi:PAAR domain-containing protein [Collimonas antrihumi]|uniref:PAAR domain-containing protein n=1 Tax=Collimonas antrihumi TaxID=1940615 RepID=UPI001B8BA4F3|nr:PAAR domain-containing protein [Collimonas antrihumi]